MYIEQHTIDDLKFRFFILPALLIIALILERTNILHISYLHIKSHELKLTTLDFHFIPGEVYYAGETVSSNNYEDANISITPDYQKLLEEDLLTIAQERSQIDIIDGNNLSFYSGPYQIKLCLDHKKVNLLDSSFFRKTVYLDIIGQYELWDKEGCDLLYVKNDQKFWVRDSIIVQGLARRAFLDNKITEIWLGQLSTHEHVQELISGFEAPYRWDEYYINLGQHLRYISGRYFIPVKREMLRTEGLNFYQAIAKWDVNQQS